MRNFLCQRTFIRDGRVERKDIIFCSNVVESSAQGIALLGNSSVRHWVMRIIEALLRPVSIDGTFD